MSALSVGQQAPAFRLLNQDSRLVNLADYGGKSYLVLYFYPKAMTPGCTTQACGLRDIQAELAALDTVVLGVSPDPVKRLKPFIEKQQLNFDLLSDEDLSLAKAYGVWGMKKFMGREFMGILRTTFIIDKQGRLSHIIDRVNTKTHHDQLLTLLKKAS